MFTLLVKQALLRLMQSYKMPIFLGAIVLGFFLVYKGYSGMTNANAASDNPIINNEGLPDIAPPSQGGGYDQSYDYSFMQARDKWGIPFALLKAHAIAESSLDSSAFRLEPSGKASYGLMQVLWWSGSDRFKKYGASADYIGDGSILYDPDRNVDIAAQLIKDNLAACKGNLRDTINMYNTGVKESTRAAPANYVNKVLNYYSKIIGRDVENV